MISIVTQYMAILTEISVTVYFKSRDFWEVVRELLVECRSVTAPKKIIIFNDIILLINNLLLVKEIIHENNNSIGH